MATPRMNGIRIEHKDPRIGSMGLNLDNVLYYRAREEMIENSSKTHFVVRVYFGPESCIIFRNDEARLLEKHLKSTGYKLADEQKDGG